MSPTPGNTTGADPRDNLFDTASIEGAGLGKRAGNASVFALSIAVVKILQQALGIAIIARLVPPAEYGIYAMALPGVFIAMALSNFGLPQAIVQKKTITHAAVSALFWINLLFALVVAGAMVALAGPVAAYYRTPEVAPVFMVVGLSLVFSAMSSQYLAILQRRMRIREAELLTLVAEILGLLTAIIGALAGLSYWSLVLQQIVTPILKTLFMGRATGWWPSRPRRALFDGAGRSVSFGGFAAGYAILGRGTEYVGTIVAGAFFDPVAVGLFHRSRNLVGIPPRRVMVPLSGVFLPAMSRLQSDAHALRTLVARMISRANLVLMPVGVLIAAGAEPLVALLLGPDWMAVVPMMFFLSAFVLREPSGAGFHYVLLACGRSGTLFAFGVARLTLVTLAAVLGAQYGLVTMTAVYSGVELLVVLPLMAIVVHRVTPVTFGLFLRTVLGDFVLAAGLAVALSALANPLLAPLPAAVHLAALALLIGAVYAVRIAVSPGARRDVGTILSRITGRLRPRAAG